MTLQLLYESLSVSYGPKFYGQAVPTASSVVKSSKLCEWCPGWEEDVQWLTLTVGDAVAQSM